MPYQRGRACAQNEEKEICCKQTTGKPGRQTQHWVSGAAGAAWGHVSGLFGAVGRRTSRTFPWAGSQKQLVRWDREGAAPGIGQLVGGVAQGVA